MNRGEEVQYGEDFIQIYTAELLQAVGHDQAMSPNVIALVTSLLALPLPQGWQHTSQHHAQVSYVTPSGQTQAEHPHQEYFEAIIRRELSQASKA